MMGGMIMTETKTNNEKYRYKCHECEHEQPIFNHHCSNCGTSLSADKDLVEGPMPEIGLEERVRKLIILTIHELTVTCPACNAGWHWSPFDTYCFNCGEHVTDTDRVRAVKGLRDEVSALRKEVKALEEQIPAPVKPKPPWWWRFWGSR